MATLLFYFQIACAVIFAGSQAMKMTESVQGVSLGFFLCHCAFSFVNLQLSKAALRETEREAADWRMKLQSVRVYRMWTGFLLLHFGIALFEGAGWNPIDSLATSVVVVGVLCIAGFAKYQGIAFGNPWIRAGLAILLKCVPQVTLAFVIYHYGDNGLSWIWFLFGHITITTRMVHLWFSSRNSWNENTKASFVSEIANELSWSIATYAFIIY